MPNFLPKVFVKRKKGIAWIFWQYLLSNLGEFLPRATFSPADICAAHPRKRRKGNTTTERKEEEEEEEEEEEGLLRTTEEIWISEEEEEGREIFRGELLVA